MRQMRVSQALVADRTIVGEVNCVFTRSDDGRVFFVSTRGNETIRQPVLEDGTIVRETRDFPWPTEWITLVDPEILGITEIKYAPLGATLIG